MTENDDKNRLSDPRNAASDGVSHRGVVASLLGVLFVMGSVVVYSPELYNMFCKATGYGGTTKRVEENNGTILDREITVRFDSTVARDLDWEFKPQQTEIKAQIGETVLVYYKARNRSTKETTGSAVYNVTPEIAGSYFNKIECFCFTEQTLAAGEEIEMPLSFFVDPEIVKDKSGRFVNEITLSYVFYAKQKSIKAARLQN